MMKDARVLYQWHLLNVFDNVPKRAVCLGRGAWRLNVDRLRAVNGLYLLWDRHDGPSVVLGNKFLT
jgi:hypothetical protein